MDRRKFIEKSVAGSSLALAAFYASPLLGASGNLQEYTLPKLTYDYAALEPYIDKQTMEIHHSKHHDTYIKNLNKEISADPSLNGLSIENILKQVSKYKPAVRNNGGGHYNHSLFWQTLSPKKTKPTESLSNAISREFGSLESFKEKFGNAATSRFGSGWAWLIIENKQLKITSTPNQDNPLMDVSEEKGFPIFGLDVWEHAYYLKYQNKRQDYITAFWNVLDWEFISKRWEANIK